ncbi:MAG: phosphoglycerate mutase family protein [Patescibacteria group bacterium]
MSKIFLVRHGQDLDNATGILNGKRDTELTELGREQVRKVAEKLPSPRSMVRRKNKIKEGGREGEIQEKNYFG